MQGTVIKLVHQGVDSPWELDVERDSDTSTPDYKRGRHPVSGTRQKAKMTVEEATWMQAVRRIQKEGLEFQCPDWIRRREVTPSVLILADRQLRYWPQNDKVFRVEYHRD